MLQTLLQQFIVHQTIFFFKIIEDISRTTPTLGLFVGLLMWMHFSHRILNMWMKFLEFFERKLEFFYLLSALETRMEVKTVAQHNVDENNRILHLWMKSDLKSLNFMWSLTLRLLVCHESCILIQICEHHILSLYFHLLLFRDSYWNTSSEPVGLHTNVKGYSFAEIQGQCQGKSLGGQRNLGVQGAAPPAGSRGQSPLVGVRGQSLLKLKPF